MCMLIHHPHNADRFTRDEFDDIYNKNKAGFGLMWRWPQSSKVSYEKGLWSSDRIWSTYNALLEHGVEEMVLHWRQRTSGPVNQDNVHPFETSTGVLISHNGVLSHRSTPQESDTRCFIADILEPALKAQGLARSINDPVWVAWLERRIQSGNKMILWPRAHATPTIVGMQRGVAYKGRWYSNLYAWTPPRDLAARQVPLWYPPLPLNSNNPSKAAANSQLRKRHKMPKPKKGSFQEWLANRWVRV